eukprot:364624-Chlamydomonas_euryale.AAC.6
MQGLAVGRVGVCVLSFALEWQNSSDAHVTGGPRGVQGWEGVGWRPWLCCENSVCGHEMKWLDEGWFGMPLAAQP